MGEQVRLLALKYSNVGLIVVGAGPPCQGVSGLNADKKGALRDKRSCLFQEVPRITDLFRTHFPWSQVHELVENVASMSGIDRSHMSKRFDRLPFRIDAKGISLCSRPRLYWVSWELHDEEGAKVTAPDMSQWENHGQVLLSAVVESKHYLHPGWSLRDQACLPTFTMSRPRGPWEEACGVGRVSEA